MSMEKFMNPESIALIGVPRNTGPGAFNNLEMMLNFGYKGKIYPVNPNANEICGFRSYPSVGEIPEIPDLAIISVGRDRVMDVFIRCAEKKIRRVVLITQGFADADEKGGKLQTELAELAKAENMRIVGPNTMGIYNAFDFFTTAFVDFKRPAEPPPITIVSQSGVMLAAEGVFSIDGIGKAIDVGNMCDVDFVDVLEYLEHDPQAKVIAMHMEGMKRGREFIEVARRVTRKKPVIVLKTGVSTIGAKAALSHTGSLVGEDAVFASAFERAGVIRVADTTEFKDAIKALLHLPPMKGNRICFITTVGAVGIMVADALEKRDLVFADIPETLPELLLKGLPGWLAVNNPLDIWPIGMIGGNFTKSYETALLELLKSPDIDGIAAVAIATGSPFHSDLDLEESIARVQKKTGYKKPVALWLYMDNISKAIQNYEKIPAVSGFPSVERAVRALSFCRKYEIIRSAPDPETG